MTLEKISIVGFRCFDQVEVSNLERLTIFIGENDVGKTVLLDAIEHLVTMQKVDPTEFRSFGEEEARETTIEGDFVLDEKDSLPTEWRYDSSKFRLKKTISKSAAKPIFSVYREDFTHSRHTRFPNNAGEQKTILQEFDVSPGRNDEERRAQWEELLQSGKVPKSIQFSPIDFSDLEPYLPKFFRTASSEYKRPEALIQSTLQEAAERELFTTDTDGNRTELKQLTEVRELMLTSMKSELKTMEDSVRRHLPSLQKMDVDGRIDFSKAIAASTLHVDTGEGLRSLENIGEGNKKKLWMGLLEWHRLNLEEIENRNVIHAYDEPDVNLHYEAQRKLFATLSEPAQNPNSRIQVLIATHSVQLIDRAPLKSIRLIECKDPPKRTVVAVDGDGDDECREFYDSIARGVGLSNSALLYEKAFIVVEGPSEANALPILYKKLFGKSMIEDGLQLIDAEGCGAIRSILKALLHYREASTVLLLDQDCTNAGSSGKITLELLKELGFSDRFQSDNCFYIGIKEYEDAFGDSVLLSTLNKHFAKGDKSEWTVGDLPDRASSEKFSEDLMNLTFHLSEPKTRKNSKKPDFARLVAQNCEPSDVPQKIKDVFDRARSIADVVPLSVTPPLPVTTSKPPETVVPQQAEMAI